MIKNDFIKAGYQVIKTEEENKLIQFLKENYPSTIRDNEIKWDELKSVLGLPVDEKLNGYGLNFIGRNVANAKYKQETDKALKINSELSVNFHTTQNMVLKGDNLDCLKILKSHYNGKIKCIYIDPPYNTAGDQFVYPDKFDKEEAEVLGLANISEADYERMQFSFNTKKSHNGWLSFMYPRILLARDLLAEDGVIFISIDDNEQANLKLLCDEIFGEGNFVGQFIWRKKEGGGQAKDDFVIEHEYISVYKKTNLFRWNDKVADRDISEFNKVDEIGNFKITKLAKWGNTARREDRPSMYFPLTAPDNSLVYPIAPDGNDGRWRVGKERMDEIISRNLLHWEEKKDNWIAYEKEYYDNQEKTLKQRSILYDVANTGDGANVLTDIFKIKDVFENPKPIELLKTFIFGGVNDNDIILDFFAGSGTTGQAVMELNAENEDKNLQFILCQIDEPIKEDKPACQFCIDNSLPPVISSITIERLKRAGEKIGKGDIGFKVFDLTDAPKLEVAEDGQISIQNTETDPLSRIYNMIFSVGVDNPTLLPECIVENCLYRIGENHYITNAEILDRSENKQHLTDAIKNGNVYIDGWTASINTTLQQYKEDVKIVF